ncbi:MAG: endoglucanase [Devosia sp.]|nr:endoglucanase [Devosia sp.]
MRTALVFTAMLALLAAQPSQAASMIFPEEWQSYLTAFVTEEGRVIDRANGDISHSEGQGYGLILAVLADDPKSFERIWSFTSAQLLIRDDGLAAWRWEPDANPHVTDINNATDGDMLIAYGLALAGKAWNVAAHAETATAMVRTIGRSLLVEADGLPAILPGAVGFGGEGGAPVVLNPSYWVFETMPVFAGLDPAINWAAVSESGLEILRRAALTPAGLPADWIVLEDGGIRPADTFPPEFGYNGIRIPLYLMRAGLDPAYLEPFRRHADAAALHRVDVLTAESLELMQEPGYRLIEAAMECTLADRPVPSELGRLATTSYYAATLQLLLLDHLRRQRPDCLDGSLGP